MSDIDFAYQPESIDKFSIKYVMKLKSTEEKY